MQHNPGIFLALTYALRDLRSGTSVLFLFLACLCLGITGIAAVQNLSRDLTASIRADGQRILGGDFALLSPQEFSPALKAELKKSGEITLVQETRAMALNTQNNLSALIDLKAVDDAYPLFGAVTLKNSGSIQKVLSPNSTGFFGAAAEKGLADKLGLKIGDSFQLGQATLILTAIIEKEPDRIAGVGFSLAPRLLIKDAALAASGLSGLGSKIDYNLRVALKPEFKTDDFSAFEKDLKELFPEANFRLRSFLNASPQTQRVIDRLTLFLTLTGLSTLLIGGIGIGNAVKSFLDQRRTRIAIFKSLGASKRFIFSVYAMQIIILSLIGITAGLFFGTLASQTAAHILGTRLGIETFYSFHADVWALCAAFGLLTTVLFSLPPLAVALDIKPSALFRDRLGLMDGHLSKSVLLAIFIVASMLIALAILTAPVMRFAIYFCIAAIISFALFFAAARLVVMALRYLPLKGRPALRLAVANITRPGSSVLSIVLSIGLGLTVLIAMADVEKNFGQLLQDDLGSDRPSFYFLDITPAQKPEFIREITSVPSARSLRMTANLRGRITAVNGVEAQKALVDRSEEWVIRSDRGFTIAAEQPPHSTLTEGEWWPTDYQGPAIVSIATDVARAFGIGVGDKLTINIFGRTVEATVANVRDIDWASFAMNFAVTFAPGALDQFPATHLATVTVDIAQEDALQTHIAKTFPNVTTVRVREALDIARGLIVTVSEAVRAGAMLTLVCGLLVLAGSIAAARRRHVYDAVVLKVLGAPRRVLLKTFLFEYGTTGLIAANLAAILGTLGGYSILRFILDLPWHFFPKDMVITTLSCLALTLLAGFIGTWHALGQKTSNYLRNS